MSKEHSATDEKQGAQWEMEQVYVFPNYDVRISDHFKVSRLLAGGWEPFAVEKSTVYLRRRREAEQDVAVDDVPPIDITGGVDPADYIEAQRPPLPGSVVLSEEDVKQAASELRGWASVLQRNKFPGAQVMRIVKLAERIGDRLYDSSNDAAVPPCHSCDETDCEVTGCEAAKGAVAEYLAAEGQEYAEVVAERDGLRELVELKEYMRQGALADLQRVVAERDELRGMLEWIRREQIHVWRERGVDVWDHIERGEQPREEFEEALRAAVARTARGDER